ncbi:helicase [Candidatus Falkowbacteria bacterium RBG_13_39_14]|uniref:Helicase n=1 Tax=Candidatus Falkowbacteria bacterium RBG_13_39_14 TaxID=1797985 RepID=A0A1F5S777_9BACT|nr:MAG: helicase [Candidatus Falkowbacteria bacterium RBG_13_39_14]
MNSDLTFITNEKGQNLKERFEVLIKDTKFFDCLVGYFYASGFHAIYKSLEKTKKVRVLIGISANPQTYDLMQKAKVEQSALQFSSAETKEKLGEIVEKEMEDAEESEKTEDGIYTFIEWIRNGKLEIRAYPSEKIHAKIYIMTFGDSDRDKGRVITGSSNFTQAGLMDNLEFNVELKNRADYDFALAKFEELWKDSVDVSQKYVETIRAKTWLNDTITPYELYLKFLYEYFKDDLSRRDEMYIKYLPVEFKKLEYQEQAALNAKKILDEYGGVFISDVVGLGKTYISAMLAGQLISEGRILVIAPPALLDKASPGSWPNVFRDFNVPATFRSIGELEKIIKDGVEQYGHVFVDEAHRFRTENNTTYEKLAEICRGKKVALVTATPYNNSPKDILSQIKLFQKTRKSAIPNLPDLENFFAHLDRKLKKLDRQKDYADYIKIVKENAKKIREKVLKYLMVRRTRAEITRYFAEDLASQKLRFPDIEKPEAVFYELNDKEDTVFTKTIELIAKKFKYARYTPILYYKGGVSQPEELAQRNMGKFMKILLIKRLESSFHAFRNSLGRFIHSYESFISEADNGNVYVSKKYTNKIFEFLAGDNDDAVETLISEGKAERLPSKDFRDEFRKDLESDLDILKKIRQLWTGVKRDPKLLSFIDKLSANSVLKKSKLVVFTESKETAEYLAKKIDEKFPNETLCFTGSSSASVREQVIENFDAKARFPKDDYRTLICTEILAEGVNLHRSNAVINYDLPWNPTRMMQRVGRINRVDTKFDKVYTFNFFPTKQANDQIKLREAAEAKISAFLSLLGGDAHLLTENEPIGSHELFSRLTSKEIITGEDGSEESELKYLHMIKSVRDKEPDTFEKIKHLPKKARTAKVMGIASQSGDKLLTYFQRGKIQKFFIASSADLSGEDLPQTDAKELDFITAAKILEAGKDTKRQKIGKDFHGLIRQNKEAFVFATAEELPDVKMRGGRDSAAKILRILKAAMKDRRKFTEDQEMYLKKVISQLEEGGLPKQTAKTTLQALNREIKEGVNPLKILSVLENNIPARLLESHFSENTSGRFGKREVILSEYLTE